MNKFKNSTKEDTNEINQTGFTNKSENDKTYREYYKEVYSLDIPRDCPLFRTHRIWSFDSGMPTKPRSGGSDVDSEHLSFEYVGIPQQALIEEPFANAEIALLCLFLPQVLYSFERQQKTEAFLKIIRKNKKATSHWY